MHPVHKNRHLQHTEAKAHATRRPFISRAACEGDLAAGGALLRRFPLGSASPWRRSRGRWRPPPPIRARLGESSARSGQRGSSAPPSSTSTPPSSTSSTSAPPSSTLRTSGAPPPPPDPCARRRRIHALEDTPPDPCARGHATGSVRSAEAVARPGGGEAAAEAMARPRRRSAAACPTSMAASLLPRAHRPPSLSQVALPPSLPPSLAAPAVRSLDPVARRRRRVARGTEAALVARRRFRSSSTPWPRPTPRPRRPRAGRRRHRQPLLPRCPCRPGPSLSLPCGCL
ncbi:hypothetical protein PVAP13_4NG156429 [Panicum virgatum]|uniref:Uncharacterized protein n=1 Tax=Panicum virgatum TaxID=38727 RepID=A0A8T0T100_PANVG|nr:hypothetical protein PVAP13_4NG156429 [Panicum virgatum]